jgi:hypothetical protein
MEAGNSIRNWDEINHLMVPPSSGLGEKPQMLINPTMKAKSYGEKVYK